MAKETRIVVSGEFDHTNGVYRLTFEVPINDVMALDANTVGSTPRFMYWIGEQITSKAVSLMEEEHNERLSG